MSVNYKAFHYTVFSSSFVLHPL